MRCFPRSICAGLAFLAGIALTTGIGLQSAHAQTTYALDGRAVLENGTGIASATIRVDGTDKTTLTNANGEYHIDGLPAGTIRVFARKDGYSFTPAPREISLPTSGEPYSPNARSRFVGTPVTKFAVFGRVLNAEEVGVPDVSITLSKPGTDYVPRTLPTSSDGRYRFEQVTLGTYVVKPRKDGLRFEPVETTISVPTSGVDSSPAARAVFRAFKVAPTTYKIFGIAKTSANLPIAGVKIYRGKTVEPGAVPVATTNTEGRWAVEGLVAGTYSFIPRLEGYKFEPGIGSATVPSSGLEWSPNGRIIFTGSKIDRYSISGKVTNSSGVGIAGVTIRPGNLDVTATTTTSGEYVLGNLPAGTYTVAASKSGFTFSPTSRSVTLPTSGEPYSPGGRANFVGTEVTTQYSIRGKVTSASGAALAGVTVRIGVDGPSTLTSTSGEYQIEHLPAGTYTVSASKTNFTFTPVSKSVTVPTAGEPYSPAGKADFVGAEQATTKYFISGKFFNGVGGALAGVTLRLGNDGPTITTGTTGEFKFENLPAGTYTVTPSRTNFTFTPTSKSVTLPTSGLAVSPNARLEFVGRESATTTYSISGRINYSNGGAPVQGVEISLNDRTDPSAITNAEGRFTITGLAAGTYTLHLDLSQHNFTPVTKTFTLPTSGLAVSPNAFAEFMATISGGDSP